MKEQTHHLKVIFLSWNYKRRIREQKRRVSRQNKSSDSDSDTELVTPPEVSRNESDNETKMSVDALSNIKRPKRRKRSSMEKLNMVNRILQNRIKIINQDHYKTIGQLLNVVPVRNGF